MRYSADFPIRLTVGIVYLWWSQCGPGGIALFIALMAAMEAVAAALRRWNERRGVVG